MSGFFSSFRIGAEEAARPSADFLNKGMLKYIVNYCTALIGAESERL
ncbi:hypothetical protein KP78_09740 [Jeotgalibacillus soli]|uniref:Uncharacterized protein n=1 Tax=Jeotgalibacillus soli TaxID=889306 RepID=A0A0C2VYQ9_9BACL|nr:hypothetical protein KP78_09740 [Jeotgalibacillus soli]